MKKLVSIFISLTMILAPINIISYAQTVIDNSTCKIATANDNLSQEQEQYKFTITKDAHVNTTTPAVGDHWFDKDSTVNVSATYNTFYTGNSGTGNYTVNNSKNIQVTSKEDPPYLTLYGNTSNIQRVRIYNPSSYVDYYSYNSMRCYPGYRIVFYHPSSRYWDNIYTEHGGLGRGATCYMTVPSTAQGSATCNIERYDGGGSNDNERVRPSGGWAVNTSTALGG